MRRQAHPGRTLKLGIRVATTTVPRHIRGARSPNHTTETGAGDFLPVPDLLCRPFRAFVVVALGSRRVVRMGVTRHPTNAWHLLSRWLRKVRSQTLAVLLCQRAGLPPVASDGLVTAD